MSVKLVSPNAPNDSLVKAGLLPRKNRIKKFHRRFVHRQPFRNVFAQMQNPAPVFLEAGPGRQSGSVGIAGLCKIRPVAGHGI